MGAHPPVGSPARPGIPGTAGSHGETGDLKATSRLWVSKATSRSLRLQRGLERVGNCLLAIAASPAGPWEVPAGVARPRLGVTSAKISAWLLQPGQEGSRSSGGGQGCASWDSSAGGCWSSPSCSAGAALAPTPAKPCSSPTQPLQSPAQAQHEDLLSPAPTQCPFRR